METRSSSMAFYEGKAPIDGFPSQSATNAELFRGFCCQSGYAGEQTTELPATWAVITPMGRHCNDVQGMLIVHDRCSHYDDVRMGAIVSLITSLTIVYSTVYSDADQRKHQSSASLAFVWGIHRGPVNSPHKWPVTRKMFPFDDVIMISTLTIVHFTD